MSFSGGVFSINSTGQPVVAGTTISASVFNSLTSDLATGLSTCMLKDGTQTATAGIGFYAGTVSLPGIYFGTDTATGFYRIGLNNTGFAINGTKLLDLGTTVLGVVGSVTVNTITVNSGTTATVFNTTATTVNAFGAASVALNIGNASGTNTILGATTFSQGVTCSTTIDATGANDTFQGSGQTTGPQAISFINTSGSSIFGVDRSAGGWWGVNVPAYATVAGSQNATEFHIVTGATPTSRVGVSNAGIVTMAAYGAGTATFSAAGVISSVSDETFKIKDGVPRNPNAMLMAIEPGYYFGKPEANMGPLRQLGFYAQNINKAIGEEAAPTPVEREMKGRDKDGNELIVKVTPPWGYFDRSVLAVNVMVTKDHEARLLALEAKL